jgi:hypothetical protein
MSSECRTRPYCTGPHRHVQYFHYCVHFLFTAGARSSSAAPQYANDPYGAPSAGIGQWTGLLVNTIGYWTTQAQDPMTGDVAIETGKYLYWT